MTLHQTFDPQVKVILDSISPDGIRLPTVQFRQPRMIHADFMTHRVFSRNGRSSRAVPVVTLLEEAKRPYTPYFLKNKPGMTATEEFTNSELVEVTDIWWNMADHTRRGVERLTERGVHKQWANRPLEWFGYIDVLLSSTDWNNYRALRDHEAAQPEIQQVAKAIFAALDRSEPKLLQPGEWHLPYIEDKDWGQARRHLYVEHGRQSEDLVLPLLKKISAARCARLTIKPFDGDGSFEAELKRYAMLIESRPVHASPVEHQATPDTQSHYRRYKITPRQGLGFERADLVSDGLDWDHPEEHGNFEGWRQARKTVPYERVA